jgi:hypothetical protein
VSRFSEADLLAQQGAIVNNHSIQRLQGWLGECISKHKECPNSTPRPLPERLIDISNPFNLVLIETDKGTAGRYVALSYCWGEKRNNESVHKIKLKRANLAAMKVNIDRDHMTLTHLEAIQVARQLGYRYVWIDALCIIQDSISDWEQQAQNVPDVYGNAELTIMAARSDDSRKGFLNLSNWYKPRASPVMLPYKTFGSTRGTASCGAGLKRNRDVGPTERRAWCFQESILSQRIATFGKEQLMFQCRKCVLYDDGYTATKTQAEELWKGILVISRPIWLDLGNMNRFDILTQWYRLVEMYSQRQVFDPMDCFATLAGVAKQFELALSSGNGVVRPRYLAGHWEIDMITGLMWRSNRICEEESNPGILRRPQKSQGPSLASEMIERAPSWSWMALEGPITIKKLDLQPYCFPARKDGAWASSDWGTNMVVAEKIKKALPFKISVKGRLRKVRVSSGSSIIMDNEELMAKYDMPKRNPSFGLINHEVINIQKEGFMMEGGEASEIFGEKPIAMGLFDLQTTNRSHKLWALPILANYRNLPVQGLLLSQNRTGVFVRRGVFWTLECQAFIRVKEQTIEIQ